MTAEQEGAAPLTGSGRRKVIARLAGRAGWNVVDQALSSLSNLVLSLLVARAVSTEAFGAFSVSFTVYAMAILVSRALLSEPLMIRFSGVDVPTFREAAGRSTGAAASLGGVIGLGVLVVGLVLRGGLGTTLVAMALLLPGLLIQDAWRMAFLAQRRPHLAALVDGAWMVVQTLALVLLLAVGVDSTVPFVVVWGLSAAVAAVVGAQRGGVLPQVRQTAAWVKAHWDITRYLTLEAVLLQGAYQGALLLVGAIGTLSDLGSLRGAQVVVGPISLLAGSAIAFGVPELSRRTTMRARHRMLAGAGLGAVLGAAGVVWGLITLLLPDPVGGALLGASWRGAQAVLLATVAGQVANLIAVGPSCVVYAMAKAKEGFLIHASVSVMLVTFGLVGLRLGGAVGAAWGFALAYWVATPFWFLTAARIARAADRSRAEAAGTPDAEGVPGAETPLAGPEVQPAP